MINEGELIELLNKSVVTYRAASYWGAEDYRCVEILMSLVDFEILESLLGNIKGRLGKQYEGKP